MNKISTWFSSRLAMAMVMLFTMAYAAAENVLTIDPVTIDSYAGVTVPVNLNSTTDLRTLIFDITLPEGVSVKGKPVMVADRLDLEPGETPADLFIIDINNNPDNKGANVWRIGLFGQEKYSIINAGKGAVVNLNLAITEAAFFAGGKFTETISAEKTNGVEGSEFTVEIVAPKAPVAEVTVPEDIEVVSGEKAQVVVSLENNLPVGGLMFDVEIPEALTLGKTGRRYEFTYGPRWSSSNSINVTEKENGVRIIISNVSTNVIAGAGKGELFSFYVVADDVHFKSDINITGINASMKWDGKNVDVYSPDQTIIAVNNALMDAAIAAMEEDEALINELVNALAEFNALVDEEFPAFAEKHGEEIGAVNAKIMGLYNTFVECQMEADAQGIYDGVPAQAMSEATAALLGLEAQEAEELAKIENGAYDDMEALQAYAEQLNPILDDEDGVYSEDVFMMACNIMGALYNYSNEIWAAEAVAKAETGVYASPLNEEIMAKLDKEMAELEELIKTTGIDAITVNSSARYYDLNGVEIANPQAGAIYIKVANGKASKHIVR